MYRTRSIDVDIDIDLEDFSDEELIEELEQRQVTIGHQHLVENIYHLKRCGKDYEQELDQLIWQVLGRI